MSITAPLVIAYLRWLADQPDGVRHREWLFHAALLLDRYERTVWVDRRQEAVDVDAVEA